MTYEQILYSVDDTIATLTLNRPEKSNSITRKLTQEIRAGIEEAKRDPEVRVLVITGAGRVFCAGVDIEERKKGMSVTMPPEGSILQSLAGGLESVLRRFYKPVIAAVNGPAVGMGCDLALAADFRIGSERAAFAESYVRLGMLPSAGPYLLPRLVGLGRAFEILLLGQRIDAQKAMEWGLLYKLVSQEELMPETYELARILAKEVSPTAVQFCKQAVYIGLENDLDGTLDHITYGRTAAELSEDSVEGFKAWEEKRAPQYTGRRRFKMGE
ncbi:enoyl-CoA hydratase/isomerase family protein [Chloroflexota bacterium]